MLYAKVDHLLEAGRPLARRRSKKSISTRRAYGVQRVCRVWADRGRVYICTRGHRRGPVGAAPDEVLVVHIRRVLEASPFHGEGYRKVWAKLRVEGIRSASTPIDARAPPPGPAPRGPGAWPEGDDEI